MRVAGRAAAKFQSAPLAEARGDWPAVSARGLWSYQVSIRSPCRSKGRSGSSVASASVASFAMFQSAPLAEARGDSGRRRSTAVESPHSFNPLPLPKQGEMPRGARVMVSLIFMFQSAPLAEARGDKEFTPRPTGTLSFACFNPLPLPKQGEILPNA